VIVVGGSIVAFVVALVTAALVAFATGSFWAAFLIGWAAGATAFVGFALVAERHQ
jgi:hypothetical protein